jgi:hypothetical protein
MIDEEAMLQHPTLSRAKNQDDSAKSLLPICSKASAESGSQVQVANLFFSNADSTFTEDSYSVVIKGAAVSSRSNHRKGSEQASNLRDGHASFIKPAKDGLSVPHYLGRFPRKVLATCRGDTSLWS